MPDPRYAYRDDHYDEDDPRMARRRGGGIRADERARDRAYRETTVRRASAVITVVTGLFAAVLGLYIMFVLLGANEGNPLVMFVADFANALALFFHNLFTPDYWVLRVLLNYGLAALFWLGIGRGLVVLLRSLR